MVQAIPEGRGGVIPHLVVNGAQAALEFYQKAFDAKILFIAPAQEDGRLMHAEFEIAGSVMYMADDFTDSMEGEMMSPQKTGGNSVGLHIYSENIDETMEKAVAAGAEVTMPAMDMFWGDRYGQVKDPFGHFWSFSTHIKDLTDEEFLAAREEFYKSMAG